MTDDPALFDTVFDNPAACRRLSESFYARVKRDPVLRPLFPGKTLTCAIEEFAAYLTQLLGGQSAHTQRRWWLSLRESHLRFPIGPRERDAWMTNMIAALDDAEIAEPVRGTLRRFFERGSAYVVNVNADAVQVRDETPHEGRLDADLSRCWHAQRLLDDVVAAIGTGDGDRALALVATAPLQAYLESRPALLAGLLAKMFDSRNPVLREYVRDRVTRTPSLTRELYNGRSLLHAAAIAGDVEWVELLLRLGANVNAGEHSPLYRVGNECHAPGGGLVVATLVRAGAAIDAREGAKLCTALHMAARRGNVDVASALLDCGADIEVPDSIGDTPLRRAVNCSKPAV